MAREDGASLAREDGAETPGRCGCCGGEFRPAHFGLAHPTPHLFVTSQWGRAPALYVLWRVAWSVFFFVWLVLTGVFVDRTSSRPENHVKWFIYLTNWAFLLLNVNLLVHAVVTVVEYFRQRSRGGYSGRYTTMPWRFKLVWVLYDIAIGISVTTSALYWGLLYGDDQLLDDVNIVTHGVNALYVLVDVLCVSGVPLRLYHVVYPCGVALIYGLFTLIYDLAGQTNALDKPYVYSVLDWSDSPGEAVLYVVLTIFVGLPVIWIVLYCLYRVRVLVYTRCCGSSHDLVV